MVKNNRKRDETGSLGFTMIALHRTLSAAVIGKRSIVSQWQSVRYSLTAQASSRQATEGTLRRPSLSPPR